MTWPEIPRLLGSFAYKRELFSKMPGSYEGTDLLIDSGAFTALTLGVEIDIVEYGNWLITNQQWIGHAASLDVIGDYRASGTNYNILKEHVGHVVPVIPAWHLGSPIDELKRLCSVTDYVAIGGCVPYSRTPKILMTHLIEAHKIARTHGTRLHGLGITGRQSMMLLPWSSVDSSSWAGGARFGSLSLVNQAGRFVVLPFGKPLTPANAALIRAYGGNPVEFAGPRFGYAGLGTIGQDQYKWGLGASARSYMYMESLLTRKFGAPFKIYLANSNPKHHVEAVRVHRLGSPFPRK